MNPLRVLFLCFHNSGRSQMAEALLKKMGGDRFLVESAGVEPRPLNPYVVRAMAEIGIDISRNEPKSAFPFIRQSRKFDFVITVCSDQQAGECPIFPGFAKRLHWDFPDPSIFSGSDEEIMAQARVLRDQIREQVRTFLQEAGGDPHAE